MAWRWVQEIKNNTQGSFYFAVPAGVEPPGKSDKVVGSIRDNVATPAEPFAQAYAANESIINDSARPQINPPNNYDVFVYGSEAGQALRMYITFTLRQGTSYNVVIGSTRYLSFLNSNGIYTSATSWNSTPDAKVQYDFWTWSLEINEDTQEIYLILIQSYFRWARTPGTANSSDRCTITMSICNIGGMGNLWQIFRDSIPGGGGGSAGPYDDGGTSTGTDTGTGDFDDTSDPVALPTLPSVSALSSGLISLYKVAQSEVSKFVGFLWSDSFSVASLSKIFSDPMQAIISFGMFPFDVSAGASVPIYLGKNNTGAVGDLVTAQYVTVPMGSVNLTEFYGGALDYNPYTKIQLVLPYCGVVNINSDEFMTKAVTVTYRVDILSGACVAFVSDGERVLQQVNGNCLVTLPYASTDFKQVYSSLLGLAGTAGAAIVAAATGGLTAPVVGGIGASLAMNTLNAKENYARGGAAGSTLGFLGVQTPYLVITRPRQCLPENNGHFQGYPLYTTERLGDLTGFTKVAQIHLDDIDATDAELKEIARLLTEGVIL